MQSSPWILLTSCANYCIWNSSVYMYLLVPKAHRPLWTPSFKPGSHIQCRKKLRKLLNSCICLWARTSCAIHFSCCWSSALYGLLAQRCSSATSTAQSSTFSRTSHLPSIGLHLVQLQHSWKHTFQKKNSAGWQRLGILKHWIFPQSPQCITCHYRRQHSVFKKAYKEYYYSA